MITLETLFSHPAGYAKRHRESPEVQSFKQNPSRESMVAYIASQTLSHTEIVPEEEQGGSIWDALTQRSSTRQARQTATFWDAVEENVEDDEAKCPYEDDDQEEQIAPPTRRRPRPNILDEDEDQYNEEEEPFNTQESSAEHALFITQQDPTHIRSRALCRPPKKGKHQPREKDHPARLTFGPALGSVRRAAHRRGTLHQQQEKSHGSSSPSNQSNQQGNDARLRKRSTRETRKAYRPPHVL